MALLKGVYHSCATYSAGQLLWVSSHFKTLFCDHARARLCTACYSVMCYCHFHVARTGSTCPRVARPLRYEVMLFKHINICFKSRLLKCAWHGGSTVCVSQSCKHTGDNCCWLPCTFKCTRPLLGEFPSQLPMKSLYLVYLYLM